MVIYFGIFALVTLLVFRQPAASVGALLCTYGLEQWAQSENAYFWAHQSLTNIMTGGVLCGALAVRFTKGKPVFNPVTREYMVMVALYLLAITSIIWSIIPAQTWEQFATMFKYVFIFGFLMPLAITDRNDLKTTLYTLLTLGFIVSLLLIANSNWADRKITFKTGVGIGAIGLERGNPLAVATLGGQVALAALLMNFRGAARFWQIFRYAVIGVGFALTVKSGSRGQAFAVVISALVFMPYSRRFRDLKSFMAFAITMVLFCVVVLVIFESLTADQMAADVDSEGRWSWKGFVEAYQGGRVNTSMQLLHAWINGGPVRWLIGIGSSGSFDPNVIGMYPHVVFTEVLGELGIIGWVILWLVPIYAYRNLRDLWQFVKDDPEDRGMVAAMAAIFLFDVILSFKQGSLLGSGSTFGLSVVFGRLLWGYRHEVAVYEQLNAGGYEMTADDWEDEEPTAGEQMLPGVAMGR